MSCSLDVNKPVNLLWDIKANKNNSLIVFLPGIIDTAETFKDEQIFTLARKAGITADMVAAGIYIKHLLKEKMIERLEADIFSHLKNKGYENIWLVGMSLGALNSLLFYQQHMNKICGVVMLSPYIADEELAHELRQAGSLRQWEPKSANNKKILKRKLVSLWKWLQQQQLKNDLNNIYLGYGNRDKFILSISLLRKILNTNNIIEVEGIHDWVTARKVWRQQLSTRNETGLLKPCN